MQIDTKKNEPRIVEDEKVEWERHRGTQVVEIEGRYKKGRPVGGRVPRADGHRQPARDAASTTRPTGETRRVRADDRTSCRPSPARSSRTPTASSWACSSRCCRRRESHWLRGFLARRVLPGLPRGGRGDLPEGQAQRRTRAPAHRPGEEAETLYKAIQKTKIMAPPTNCSRPSARSRSSPACSSRCKAEFFTASTRPPAVYRGNPFQIEVGLAYGGAGAGGGRP